VALAIGAGDWSRSMRLGPAPYQPPGGARTLYEIFGHGNEEIGSPSGGLGLANSIIRRPIVRKARVSARWRFFLMGRPCWICPLRAAFPCGAHQEPDETCDPSH
jgi:hypothetical protein